MYDAIVVGGRCAGSPTAMLLAQKGYKVLLLDKTTFPSDTISTHIVWPRGAACLKDWGLLEKVASSNCPPLDHKMSFDFGPFALTGKHPAYEGVSDCYAPRRTVLDTILVNAAADAGVDVRAGTAVEDLVRDGESVTGVRCNTGNGSVVEKARIVIGADGRNSIVARKAGVEEYNVKPKYACWYYSYWSGLPTDQIVFYTRPERAIGRIPTNDGLVCVAVSTPMREFDKCRADVEGSYHRSLELVPELAEMVRDGKREERYFGTGDVPNFFRRPFGPGWALVGDAGYHKDPIGAQGISDAFRDAERLTDALDEGFSGRRPLDEALADYERKRNEEVTPMYHLNCDLASHEPPPPEMRQLFAALPGNQPDTDRFFGALAGTVPVEEFFSAENVRRIISEAAAGNEE
jgi:flavin-dependent dehydrogenase